MPWSQTTLVVIALWASVAAAQTAAPAAVRASEGDGPPLALAEAVRTALRIHPNIQAARALIDERSADVRGAEAVLDPVLLASAGRTRNRSPVLAGERLASETLLLDDTSVLSVAGAKTMPWGMQIAPSVTLTGLNERRSPDDPALARTAQINARARTDLTAIQPLLRGRGEVGTLSTLRAAERDREAAIHTAAFIAQQTVFGVISAYWDLAGAIGQVGILSESEQRARKLLDETRILVQANQRPAADLVPIEGHLWTAVSALIDARRARRSAAHALDLAMGRTGAEATPDWRPADTLPRPVPAAAAPPSTMGGGATSAREDVRAAGQSIESTRALLAGAERNTLPQLDLRVSLGYEGGVDGDQGDQIDALARALGTNVGGLNAGAALTLELPLRNDARKAVRDFQSAELRRRESDRNELELQVRVGVASALDDLSLSAEALAAAEQAADRYARAVEDERTKLKAGLATVVDVVFTQDLLTQAELGRLRSRLDFAQALARVRFQAGDLPSDEAQVPERVRLVLDARAPRGGNAGH
jgi:outer membrane protein TolC